MLIWKKFLFGLMPLRSQVSICAKFEDIRSSILEELRNAKKDVKVAVYWFTNEELFESLLNCLKRGVNVELIVHNDYINNRSGGLPLAQFIENNGNLFFSREIAQMHNKFCVIDGTVLINGSYNWTYYAESKNSENILLIKNSRNTCDSFLNEFENIKSKLTRVENIVSVSPQTITDKSNDAIREYMAMDILYKAHSLGQKKLDNDNLIIESTSYKVQKTAAELNLVNPRSLRSSISCELKENRLRGIMKKGSAVPFSNDIIVRTIDDNQKVMKITFRSGESVRANENNVILSTRLTGLVELPAGEVLVRITCQVGINGIMDIIMESLDNQVNKKIRINISHLLV